VAGEDVPSVALVAVDNTVLEHLVQAATNGAAADEVTPALTAGRSWTPTRIAWLRDFHRDRRAGLAGPSGEATWAVVIDGRGVGSVRLKRTQEHGVLEIGVWLTRRARGSGVGRAATAAVLREAAATEASAVQANTTVGNAGALAVLNRLGFDLGSSDHAHHIRVLLLLGPESLR